MYLEIPNTAALQEKRIWENSLMTYWSVITKPGQ